jgi:hypothetical protein
MSDDVEIPTKEILDKYYQEYCIACENHNNSLNEMIEHAKNGDLSEWDTANRQYNFAIDLIKAFQMGRDLARYGYIGDYPEFTGIGS